MRNEPLSQEKVVEAIELRKKKENDIITAKELKRLQIIMMEQHEWIKELNASGYAGILSNGNIVDRRTHPKAIPVQQNAMFGVVKPKSL